MKRITITLSDEAEQRVMEYRIASWKQSKDLNWTQAINQMLLELE